MNKTFVPIPEHIYDAHPHSFALEVVGRCMEPFLNESDIVVCDPCAEPKQGEVAVFIDSHRVSYVGIFSATTDEITITPINPVHEPHVFKTCDPHTLCAVVWTMTGAAPKPQLQHIYSVDSARGQR